MPRATKKKVIAAPKRVPALNVTPIHDCEDEALLTFGEYSLPMSTIMRDILFEAIIRDFYPGKTHKQQKQKQNAA